MVLRSVHDPSFHDTVSSWIHSFGEIFLVARYAYAAGSKDYFLIRSLLKFEEVLATLPPRTDVIVLRQRQLPIRGIGGGLFFDLASKEIAEGDWWFLCSFDGSNPKAISTEGDNSIMAMKIAISEHDGEDLAIGTDPPYHEADNADMQSALVPLPDGTLERGVY